MTILFIQTAINKASNRWINSQVDTSNHRESRKREYTGQVVIEIGGYEQYERTEPEHSE